MATMATIPVKQASEEDVNSSITSSTPLPLNQAASEAQHPELTREGESLREKGLDPSSTSATAVGNDPSSSTHKNFLAKALHCFHTHYDLDLPCCLFLLGFFIIFGISYFFMNVMANVASNRSPDNTIYPILPDAGFDGIPEIKILWLTDFFDYVLLVFAFVLALTRPAPLLVVVKSVAAMLLTNLLRITTVAITSFPDPRPGCIKHSGNPFGNATLHRCGDCMFSGHTILYVISALIWFTYAPQGRFWRLGTFLMFCGAFAGGMIIIANRAHYTVDVLVAVYCTIGSFYFVRWHWRYVEGIHWLRRIHAPNGRVYAAEQDWRLLADVGPWSGGFIGEGSRLGKSHSHAPLSLPSTTSEAERMRLVQAAQRATPQDVVVNMTTAAAQHFPHQTPPPPLTTVAPTPSSSSSSNPAPHHLSDSLRPRASHSTVPHDSVPA